MSKLGRFFVIILVVSLPSCRDKPSGIDNHRIQWLKQHASAIESIDPANENFADLAPLGKALDGVKVVMLGEQSHGDGATFLAKTRIIKYLHRELGFDVLVFEGGLFDYRKAGELLEEGFSPDSAFVKFGSVWGESSQLNPLVEYWGRTNQKQRPLELAGLDCQFSGYAQAYLWEEMMDWIDAVGMDSVCQERKTHSDNLFAHWSPPPGDPQGSFLEALDCLRESVRLTKRGTQEREFWAQILDNIDTEIKRLSGRVDAWGSYNLRDRQMADNLLWLTRSYYPERRIMVWAASAHIARNVAEVRSLENPESRAEYVSMGEMVHAALGSEVYSLGFTAFEGSFDHYGKPQALEAPGDGALEDLFHRAGYELAFLDFRKPPAGGEWLSTPFIARPFGYDQHLANWPNTLDGMFYTRVMTPSTRK